MSTGRWALFALAGALLIFSVIRTIQGDEYLWATGVAMVIVMGSMLWKRRKGAKTTAGTAEASEVTTSDPTSRRQPPSVH